MGQRRRWHAALESVVKWLFDFFFETLCRFVGHKFTPISGWSRSLGIEEKQYQGCTGCKKVVVKYRRGIPIELRSRRDYP